MEISGRYPRTLRRLMMVGIDPDVLIELMKSGARNRPFICVEGLPIGAEFHSAGYDHIRGQPYIVVQHDDFPEVPPGCPLPYHNSIVFQKMKMRWVPESEPSFMDPLKNSNPLAQHGQS